jgi:hypothetical protein
VSSARPPRHYEGERSAKVGATGEQPSGSGTCNPALGASKGRTNITTRSGVTWESTLAARAAFRAGVAYALMIFAVGFVLGSLRILTVAPYLGETAAVGLEVPLMLAISWFLAGWTAKKFTVPHHAVDRALMGGVAFTLLMVAELLLGLVVFGAAFELRSPLPHLLPARSGSPGKFCPRRVRCCGSCA